MRGVIAAALLVAGLPAAASTVSMHRDGAVYHVEGEFSVHAVSSTAWNVITDYDGIGNFVSSIKSSRVLSREDGVVTVQQAVKPSFLIFSRRIDVTLSVREQPPHRVSFEQAGDEPFELYEGHWEIVPGGPACVVRYELAVAPGSAAGPRFVLRRSLPKNVARQLDEVRAEIQRRAGVAQKSRPQEARP